MDKVNRKRQKFQHLDLEKREEISIYLEKGWNNTEIAQEIGVHRSTVGREIERNSPEHRKVKYRAHRAQQRSDHRKKASRQKERLKNQSTRDYVVSKIKDKLSPEQVAGVIQIERPGWKINHESIYQYIYAERQDLIPHLRQGRKRRLKHGQAKNKRCIRVPERTMIGERPEHINNREEFGHWEADTMISRKSKACLMVTLERKSGYRVLDKLPSRTAEEMNRGLVEKLGELPARLVKTLTYDNGTENAFHQETNKVLRTQSYFCNPYHSWEKGSVENLNGLIRQYLPKGVDLAKISEYELKLIQNRLNTRPRKRLGYRSPAEIFCNLVA